MKTITVFFIAAACIFATAFAEQDKRHQDRSKEAVMAVIQEEKDAFLAADENRMAATWIQTPSAAKVYVFGGKEMRFDGYVAVAAHDREGMAHEKSLSSAQRSRFAFSNPQVSLLGDSAWVVCDARWDGYADGQPATAAQARTYVLTKDGGRWKIALMSIAELLCKPDASPTAGVEKELIQLENDWAKAYLTCDGKALDRIEADGWGYTDADGVYYTKAEDIADVTGGDFKATVFEMADLKVRAFGDTAVVTGKQTVKFTFKGEPTDAVLSITDVFQRRQGRWQAISSATVRRAPAKPTPPSNATMSLDQ